jgi:glycosyltransferase involved in cell wall biosynthesis
MDITVVIPTIPPRRKMLARAVQSVARQTRPAAAMSIATDVRKEGAPKTRQRALEVVNTPLVAFLDDDDAFTPYHLESLYDHMMDTGADYAYSWYRVIRERDGYVYPEDPVFPPGHFSDPWDNDNPRQTTIVTLVKTKLAKEVGFVYDEYEDTGDGQVSGEDWQFTLGCMHAGAKISHLAKHTWLWYHGTGNTSGRPDRW